MQISADTYSALADVSAEFTPPPACDLDDSTLLDAQRTLAEIRRRVDASAAVVAAEIARRSAPELGYDGLAQRLGARTPEKLVQQVTGTSARDAGSLVRVGTMMNTPPSAPNYAPWLRDVSAAVTAGTLSLDRADVIRAGLGQPDADITADDLTGAATVLLRESPSLSLERLAARARDLRNELDLAGVADREQKLRDRRQLHLIPQADGMTRLAGLLDPESAAIVTAAYDAATSPRRGGPRFIDVEAQEREQRLLDDDRTTEQIALDAFVELIRIGTRADTGAVVGVRKPGVTVHVTAEDLQAGLGLGHIAGQGSAVSLATVERLGCELGIITVLLDASGQALDVGRNERLFTYRQRIALEARDGGCRFPGCDRPASWTEAHHIRLWSHGGATDVRDGILLCRHHHMLVHNNGWQVIRRGSDYLVVPPPSIDPEQRPIPAPSRSPIRRRVESPPG
jgi:hypothetical protein